MPLAALFHGLLALLERVVFASKLFFTFLLGGLGQLAVHAAAAFLLLAALLHCLIPVATGEKLALFLLALLAGALFESPVRAAVAHSAALAPGLHELGTKESAGRRGCGTAGRTSSRPYRRCSSKPLLRSGQRPQRAGER